MAGTYTVVAHRCRQTGNRLPGSGGGQGKPDRRRSRAPWPRGNRHRLVSGRAVGPREQGRIGPGIWELPPARTRPAATREPPGDRTTGSADLPWSEKRRDCITCHDPCQAIPAQKVGLAEGRWSRVEEGDFWNTEAVGGAAGLAAGTWMVQKWQTVQGLRGVAKCIQDLSRADLGSPPGGRWPCQVANSAGSRRSSDRCMVRGSDRTVVPQVGRGAVGSLLLTGTVDATYIPMWSIRPGLGDYTGS